LPCYCNCPFCLVTLPSEDTWKLKHVKMIFTLYFYHFYVKNIFLGALSKINMPYVE
jgi:hypothetical protein